MNPITNSLKFFSSTLFNILLAFIFFLIAGKFTNPAFVGQVAIIQLMETISITFFTLLPYNIITREISEKFTNKEDYKDIIYTSLSYSILISPLVLILLFFPSYLYLSIPYFILFVYTAYQSSILSGLGKFTEISIGNILLVIFRWGLSIISVYYHSILLLIFFWTLGALIKAIYYQFFIPFKFRFDINIAKEIVKIGFPIYLSGIVSFISSQGDRVITAFLLGSYYLGIYQLVALISTLPLLLLLNSFSSSLLPSSTHYYAKGIELHKMSSLTLRLLTLISLPIAIIGFYITPIFLQTFFPKYILGKEALEILILSLTAIIPLQILSTFLITLKKNYKIFIYIGTISALTVIIFSYLLIPIYNITGAAISQLLNAIITSLLILYYSYKQNIIKLTKKEIYSIILIFLSFLSFINWYLTLIIILLLFKLFKIITKDDLKIIDIFLPNYLK
ncbi:MAG: oligosaccharide flippase family protein, partial [Nanopusillaceae archaeon]